MILWMCGDCTISNLIGMISNCWATSKLYVTSIFHTSAQPWSVNKRGCVERFRMAVKHRAAKSGEMCPVSAEDLTIQVADSFLRLPLIYGTINTSVILLLHDPSKGAYPWSIWMLEYSDSLTFHSIEQLVCSVQPLPHFGYPTRFRRTCYPQQERHRTSQFRCSRLSLEILLSFCEWAEIGRTVEPFLDHCFGVSDQICRTKDHKIDDCSQTINAILGVRYGCSHPHVHSKKPS